MRKRVYIAGPYTKGNLAANVHQAVLVASRLWELGYAPFVPHLSHLWHLIDPHEYEMWLEYDEEWIGCCHALLRIPGESHGADREWRLADHLHIPCFHSITDLLVGMPP